MYLYFSLLLQNIFLGNLVHSSSSTIFLDERYIDYLFLNMYENHEKRKKDR